MGLVIEQYVYKMCIPISTSTFSIFILQLLVWFSWMPISALHGWQHWEVMADPVLWTRSRDYHLSKCTCFERFLIPELGHLLTKKLFCAQITWGAGNRFLAFFLCEWKEAIWYTRNTQPRILIGRLGRIPLEHHEDCLRFSRLILWIRKSSWL